jgi:hypothetical protein
MKLVLKKPELGMHVKKLVGSIIYYDDSMDMSSWDEDDFEGCLSSSKISVREG